MHAFDADAFDPTAFDTPGDVPDVGTTPGPTGIATELVPSGIASTPGPTGIATNLAPK